MGTYCLVSRKISTARSRFANCKLSLLTVVLICPGWIRAGPPLGPAAIRSGVNRSTGRGENAGGGGGHPAPSTRPCPILFRERVREPAHDPLPESCLSTCSDRMNRAPGLCAYRFRQTGTSFTTASAWSASFLTSAYRSNSCMPAPLFLCLISARANRSCDMAVCLRTLLRFRDSRSVAIWVCHCFGAISRSFRAFLFCRAKGPK